tara:strand:- start:2811 stop:3611 length:801 start_codon:yes stop_codon:yes gene_type:complete
MTPDAEEVVRIAHQAGTAIMGLYDETTGIPFQTKEDSSPLTKADLAAHETIQTGLLSAFPLLPLVSEEGRAGNPLESEFSWLVDPLDGTKEFIKRNDMFTVNIALMRRTGNRWKPVFGVVHAPATGITWVGGAKHPSERRKMGVNTYIRVNEEITNPVNLVASGSHRSQVDESFANKLGSYSLVRMGSSLKACAVADGSADLYPRFGPTSCWDIAAAHAVVVAAGGLVVGPDGNELDYDLVDDVLNPHFLVACSPRWNHIWVDNQD